MYCRKCGALNDDNAFRCTRCGEITAVVAPTKVESHMIFAVLTTLFCCIPFGIAAIVYAAQVSAKAQAGDVAGAELASQKAKMWCWWAFGVGLAANVLITGLSILNEASK